MKRESQKQQEDDTREQTSGDWLRACIKTPRHDCSDRVVQTREKNSFKMAEKEKPGPLRFLLALAIVLLVVYCVSLSVFLVYLMRDYSQLKQHVQGLRSRVASLEKSKVTARATVSPSGGKKSRENKDSKLQETQQVSRYWVSASCAIRCLIFDAVLIVILTHADLHANAFGDSKSTYIHCLPLFVTSKQHVTSHYLPATKSVLF